ncbi:MAG: hypothetical protein R3F65_32695 [bacterium]
MIRHRIGAELARRVAAEVPEWAALVQRAQAHYTRYGQALDFRQAAFPGESEVERKARLADARSCWKPIRRILRDLQRHKCAYCEQTLPGGEPGLAHFHVEHIRPVRGAMRWKTDAYTGEAIPARWQTRRGRHYKQTPTPGDGYPWLAFDLTNLCAACSVCNVALKGSYYPIAGEPGPRDTDPAALDAVERPLLLRPVGDDGGLSPEDCMTFDGLTPRSWFDPQDPRSEAVAVTVRLLGLSPVATQAGAAGRRELLVERCYALDAAWQRIQAREEAVGRGDEVARAAHDAELGRLRGAAAMQTACVRGLVESFERDPAATAEVMRAVQAVWDQLRG